MNHYEILLLSSSSRTSDTRRKLVFAVIALFFMANIVTNFIHGIINQHSVIYAFLVICCIAVIFFEKTIYLSNAGIVKETRALFSSGTEILPWAEVSFVTILAKGSNIVAFIERNEDVSGWKIAFKRSELDKLKEILKEHIAKGKINDMSNKR